MSAFSLAILVCLCNFEISIIIFWLNPASFCFLEYTLRVIYYGKKPQSCYPQLLLKYYCSFLFQVAETKRNPGMCAAGDLSFPVHTKVHSFGRDGHLHWNSAISILPILFFGSRAHGIFKKKIYFFKAGHRQK